MAIRCAAAGLLVALVSAADPPAPPTLPPLDGCRWIHAAPDRTAAPRITVIELWKPWSSESNAQLPRLSRIARERAADGVAVLGITREASGYSADRIEESLRRLGGRVTFAVGIAPADLHAGLAALCARDRAGGGPAGDTLVADASGSIVAACTSSDVEQVLLRMLAGTWTGPHMIDDIRRESRAMDALVKVSAGDPALAAQQLDEMMATHQHRTRDFASRRIVILLRAGRADEAASAMRAATEEWTRLQDAAELTTLATLWMDSRINASGREPGMAADAAEAAALISGDLDPNPWLLLMRARLAAGDPAGARVAGERAMLIGDDRMRDRVAQMLERIPAQPAGGSDGQSQQPAQP